MIKNEALENKLKESENRYRALMESASDQIFMFNERYEFVSVNSATARQFGKKPDEIIGKHISEVFPKEIATKNINNLDSVFKTGRNYSVEEELSFGGHKIYVSTSLSPVKNMEGKTVGVLGVVRDITERRNAERLIRESEEKFKTIFDNANDGFLVASAKDKKFILGNKAICEMTGYTLEEIKNLSIMDIHPQNDLPYIIDQFEKQAKKKIKVSENLPVIRKDGRIFYADVNASPITFLGETYLLGVFRDITERKKTEEALRISKDYLGNIINSIADPVFVKDESFRFLLANDALCNMLGMKREDIIGKTLGESLPQDQMEHFLKVDKMVFGSGQENVCEESLTGKDGKTFTIVTKKTRYIDAKQNKFLVGVIRDVTERKQAEAQFKQLQQEQQVMLDHVPAWIFFKDKENRFVRVNKVFAEIMGMPKEQLEGRSLFDIYPKEKAEAFWKDDKEVLESGIPKVNIIESLEINKEMRWLQTDKIPYRDANGNIAGILGFTVDITERRAAERLLKDSQESFKLIFEDAPDAYYLNDMKGNFIDGNKEAEKLLEYKKEDLIGKSFLKLGILPRDQILKAGNVLVKNIAGLSSGPDEFVLNRKNKTKIQVEILSRPVNIKGRKLVLGIARDITNRKLAEVTLRDSEEKFKALLDSAPDAFFVYDGKGVFIEGNLAAEKLIGYRRDELIGKSFLSTKILSADQLIKGVADLAKNALGIKTEAREYILNRKDGSNVIAEINSTPIKIKGRQYILGVARDLTERKKNEIELYKSKNFIENIYNNLDIPVSVIDVNSYEFVSANKALLDELKVGEKDIIGKHCYEITHHRSSPCEPPNDICPINEALKLGGKASEEHRHFTQDGQEIIVKVTAIPLKDENNKINQVIHITENITARKNAEEMKEKLLHRIEEANRNKTQFVSDVSHELRTPLASIKGFVSTIRSDPAMDVKTRLDFLRIAEEETDRLTRIIDDLLDISRVESGRLKLTMHSFNIIDLIMKNIELLKPQAESKGINIKSDLPSLKHIVYADEDKTSQVITNLLSNAIKYNKQSGKIVVSSSQENGKIRINVEDTGIGIAEKDIPRMFEKFFRADEAAAQAQGTGLGLPVTKGLIESMGGELAFKSKHGEGSNFSFTLPRQKQDRKD